MCRLWAFGIISCFCPQKYKVPMPSPFIKYIQNEQHCTEVISRAATVKQSLGIGTADIKGLYVICIDRIG